MAAAIDIIDGPPSPSEPRRAIIPVPLSALQRMVARAECARSGGFWSIEDEQAYLLCRAALANGTAA
jgi:hypothetical protein